MHRLILSKTFGGHRSKASRRTRDASTHRFFSRTFGRFLVKTSTIAVDETDIALQHTTFLGRLYCWWLPRRPGFNTQVLLEGLRSPTTRY